MRCITPSAGPPYGSVPYNRRRSMPDWTAERIAELSIEDVKTLQKNATKLGNTLVAGLCDGDITRRTGARDKGLQVRAVSGSRHGQVVVGFHFVCPRGKGLRRIPTGPSGPGLGSSTKFMPNAASRLALTSRCMPQKLNHPIFRVLLRPGEKRNAIGSTQRVDL
jgi:hypothetical protein